LRQFDYKGVRIHECPKCRGRWFQRGELKKAKDRTDDDLRWLDWDPFGPDADRYAVHSSKTLLCPDCSTRMKSLNYSTSGVTIYKCPTCYGIWLSHGEFAAIIKYLEKKIDTESAAELAKDAVRQFEKIATREEDKISEIRDFLAVLKLLEMRIAVEHPALAAAAEKIQEASPLN
jgi:Zn-finger nucleic acid-binding protein